MISKDMERQSNRVSEQQRCAPGPHWMRSLCSPAPCHHRTRPFYTPAPCPLPDQAPSARTFLLQIKPSAEPTTLHAEKTLHKNNYHLSAYETQL